MMRTMLLLPKEDDPTFFSKAVAYLAVFLLILLTGCVPVSQNGYHGAVVEVADGDTIRLANGEWIRYLGIDTPELHHPRKEIIPEYLAEEAKEFNERLVAGKAVRLEFDRERRDKYGRLLAYVYVDDTFVNARLIEEGYARIFIIPPNVKYADEFLKLEQKARKEKRGIWNK